MTECLNCGWKGEIDVENMPESREKYAQCCPGCGRQTMIDGEKTVEPIKDAFDIGYDTAISKVAELVSEDIKEEVDES